MTGDVILTGLPRAGSAVLGALIDFMPDTVCLNSPLWHNHFVAKQTHAMPVCKWLMGDFYWQRRQMAHRIPVADYRNADASPLMDSASILTGAPRQVHFTRENLSEQCTLVMRHTLLYTALLPQLVEFGHFRRIAVIRDPVDVLLSWQKMPSAIFALYDPTTIGWLWPQAQAAALGSGNELDRLARLAELFYQRYYEMQNWVEIVRYETLAADPLLASRLFGLDKAAANAGQVVPPKQRIHAEGIVNDVRAAIDKYGVFAKRFYAM